MNRIVFGAFLLLGTHHSPSASALAVAHQGEAQEERTASRGRSEQEVLLQDRLFAIPGKQVHLLRIEYPPGWIGRRHYHTGDVVLYVLEGRFTIDVDGAARKTIGPGEVYHEAVNKEMQARNASTDEPTKILLFQVGDPGERTTVITD
jgi:quercetin dioxygenase-like cupin family protein